LLSPSAISSFDAFLDRLAARLAAPLPGHSAHVRMSPQSPRQEALSVEDRPCREAGVLVLLLPPADASRVVLTVRRDDLPDHGGQISFPGGQREGDETLRETALREAEEEIGLAPASVRLLGDLTPLYIPPSNFCVHPVLGATAADGALRPSDREVERVLRVPGRTLLDPDTRVVEPWTLHGRSVDVPYYDVGDHAVWGATAMMLAEVLDVVRAVRDADASSAPRGS
jgi:8-oxo-dGTP pyrophosphatase MutT (NUDIX family)